LACPDENTFAAFVDGSLAADAQQALASHVDGCEACQVVLSDLARLRSHVSAVGTEASDASRVRAQAADASRAEPEPALDVADAPDATSVGRYTIESTLGRGGMGVVHRAWDPVLARRVALKLIRKDRSDASSGDRLLREARAMAAVSHPHVVQVYDAGVHDGQVYIAMELVDGEPLDARIARGPLPYRAIVDLFQQAGLGLAHAHAAGILHRDFKPSNVFIDRAGAVKVGDFGLSRLGPASLADPEAADFETAVGTVVGTVRYMAPEQAFGLPVDARADQFSFAVALYHALFGRFPFQGRTLDELRFEFSRQRATPPTDLRGAPPACVAPIMRALSARPEDRFATTTELLEALDQADQEAYAGHLRVHVICQLVFGACHLVATIAFAIGMIVAVTRPSPDPSPPEPGDPSTWNPAVGLFAVVGMLLWIAFLVFGTFWAPINAWGLSRRYAWARRSTLLYAIVAASTCIGVPYAIYAFWSLGQPAVRWAFARPIAPKKP